MDVKIYWKYMDMINIAQYGYMCHFGVHTIPHWQRLTKGGKWWHSVGKDRSEWSRVVEGGICSKCW